MSDFFISNAWAQAAQPQGGGTSFFIMMVVFFVIFYFLLIRPQQKQAREHKEMIESLSKGDEVVTSGGVLGRISKIGDSFIFLEVAENLEIKVERNSIARVMVKGTIKNL